MQSEHPVVVVWIPKRWTTVVACVLMALLWVPAVLLSWSAWRGAAAHWRHQPFTPDAVQAADQRLWLEDLIAVSLVAAVAALAVALLLRHDRGRGTLLAWCLAGVAFLLWLGGPAAKGSSDMQSIACQNPNARDDGEAYVDLRGWSWTRFADVAVRPAGAGMHEVRC